MRPEISPDFEDFRYYKYDYAYTSKDEDKKQRKFFWFRGDNSRKGDEPTEEDLAKGAIMGLGKQKTGKWKLPLGIAALALLVSGILWQNGVIGPFKLPGSERLIQKEPIKPVTKKKPIKTADKSVSQVTPVSKMKGPIERDKGSTQLQSRGSPSKKNGTESQKGAGQDVSKWGLSAKSVSKTTDRPTEDNKKVQARPESSSLKSIAARFWKRTVKDIKTSIPTGKPTSQPKSRVAGSKQHVPKKIETTSSQKRLEKAGKTSNKAAKTPVPQTKSVSESKVKVVEEGKGGQSQPKTSPSKKVVSKPQKEQVKESKTVITRAGTISKWTGIEESDKEFVQSMPKTSFPKLIRAKTTKRRVRESKITIPQAGAISKWTVPDENDEEFVWAMPKASFPKLIRAKTIKYRVKGGRIAIPRNNSKSESKAPIVGDEEGFQIQPKAASIKAIVSKTQAETAGVAQIPLAPSFPEETGQRDIIITGNPDKKPSYPYSLYLGSFRTEERAEKAIAFYSKNGFSPYRAKVEFREKGLWYRVYGGYFKDTKQAYQFKEKHDLSEATVRKTNYSNLVGIYSNHNELKDKISRLENMGYSPYVIKGNNGGTSLFLGAYITKEGAEHQSQDLKIRGITVQVISR